MDLVTACLGEAISLNPPIEGSSAPHARDLQADRSTWTQRERAPLGEPLIAYT